MVPPAPQEFFSFVSSDCRSLSFASKPRTTLTTFPFFRFSRMTRAVCLLGSIHTFCSSNGGQVHSLSSFSQRSQRFGTSHFVPANRPILIPRQAAWFALVSATVLNLQRQYSFKRQFLFKTLLSQLLDPSPRIAGRIPKTSTFFGRSTPTSAME